MSPPGPSEPERSLTDPQVPLIVAKIANGDPIQLVWHNDLDGRTYRVDRRSGTEYVKWAPDSPEIDLGLEARKLAWARQYISVPEVLGQGRDTESSAWLHTRGIPAESAIAERWKAEPRQAARAIGEGLRTLHDQLPVRECLWSWRVAGRASMVNDPVGKTLLAQAPPEDDLVVCHGDACSPNTLIAQDGSYAGHVDLGSLGVADRWADLAIATYALTWNYEPAYEDELLDAYGIARDEERVSYYRRLWDTEGEDSQGLSTPIAPPLPP